MSTSSSSSSSTSSSASSSASSGPSARPLAGKVALVTGGSRGIGAAIARRLARDGADVAISYASSVELAQAVVADLEAHGVQGRAFQADQGDPAQVTALVQRVATELGHGRLDILVNNAGVFIPAAIEDPAADLEAIGRQFAVNVHGVRAAVQAAVPFLGEGGRVITVGSIAGDRSPWAGLADYSATKAALAAYGRGWARDLGPRGITVNTVQPGPIDTDMAPKDGPVADLLREGTPLKRYGTPEEVAAVVAFFARPDSSYVTGATLNVDGGHSA